MVLPTVQCHGSSSTIPHIPCDWHGVWPRRPVVIPRKLMVGDIPMIGVRAMSALHNGWQQFGGVQIDTDGYNVSQYFDLQGRYKGPDEHGVEPTFRPMTEEEISEYIAQESA